MSSRNRSGKLKVLSVLLLAAVAVASCRSDPAPTYERPSPPPAAEAPPPEAADPTMPPMNRPPPPRPVLDEELPPISSAPPSFCGGIAGITCAEGNYCFYDKGTCGRSDQGGTCAPKPDKCALNYQPVCGCDGQTYSNDCGASLVGISVKHSGEC